MPAANTPIIGMFDDDPRNLSPQVAYEEQSSQKGELVVDLLMVRSNPPDEDPSRYQRLEICDRWSDEDREKVGERHDWMNVLNGDTFGWTTAWMKWRSGKPMLQWVKDTKK